jgi:UPF0755 protein
MVKFRANPATGKWRKAAIAILISCSLALVGGIIAVRQIYTSNLKPLNTIQKSQLFVIESGASVKEIALGLEKTGIIRKAWAFEWYVRNNDLRDLLQAGTYSLRPSLSVQQVAAILTEGKVDTSLVTILPAQRLDQIKDSFINKYGFDPQEVDAALDPDAYRDHPALVDKPAGASLEGYLYPETFQKTADTKPHAIVRAALDEMQKHLTPDLRAGIVRQGLTVHEGIILASVVANEVGKPEDKPLVAQVFLRRLRESKPLESDATSAYGAILAGQPPSITF